MRFGAYLSALVALSTAFACSENAPNGASGGMGSNASGLTSSGSSAANGGTQAGGSGDAASGGVPGLGGSATAGGGSPGQSITWAQDIAPIVYRECVGCHREGGVGPFPLESYEQTSEIASVLAAEIAERHMPPMPVDGSGACNTYSNARWLTEAEIELFQAWDEAGAPLGDPTLAPPLPAPPPRLDTPDLSLDPGEEYLPNAQLTDDYRCFVIDPALTAAKFIVAYEVNPGDARVVHHAIVYQPESDAAASEALELDANEAGAGYTCFGGVGVSAEPRVLWAPGGGFVELPQDTGVPLAAGRKLILQVHYNLSNGAFPDRTTVKLALRDEVRFPARYQAIADLEMRLEPGLERATTTRTFSALGQAVVVHGVMPHMHTLGRELRVMAQADAQEHCLVSVDRWDFHSQNAWWYTEALTYGAVESVSISCTYDTTRRTEAVTWGEGTQDEMCLTYLYVTQPG
jgi:hypothetical protein